jgi:hypothetical protein
MRRLHQGHQGAQKSTITGTFELITFCSQVEESTSIETMVHHERYAANITKLEDEQINNLEPKVQVEKPPDLAASYGLKV